MKRNIAVVVLAAGSSSRMGEPKQLLPLASTTLLRRIVAQALVSDAKMTIVVLGAHCSAIRRELDALPVSIIENVRWSEGIGTSIAAGIKGATDTDAAVIITCDQPHVSAAIINRLIAEHDSTGKPIIASAYSNTLGVPAFFGREFFAQLQQLPADEGAKALFHQHRASVATIDFAEGAFDLDTRADYDRFLHR